MAAGLLPSLRLRCFRRSPRNMRPWREERELAARQKAAALRREIRCERFAGGAAWCGEMQAKGHGRERGAVRGLVCQREGDDAVSCPFWDWAQTGSVPFGNCAP